MTADRAPESLLPLTAVSFEILLTLSDDDAHGYHIMQEVERRTGGAIVLHPGTLYRALARLLDEALIEERDPHQEGPASPLDGTRGALSDSRRIAGLTKGGLKPAPPIVRRRYYSLTKFGRTVLMAEATRLEQQVRAARARRLLRREGR